MMSALLQMAHRPVISLPETASLEEAVRVMRERAVAAVLILEAGRPKGICTERDVIGKLVREGRNPKTVPVSAAMTQPVLTIPQDGKPADALALMLDRRIRHLPVVDEAGKAVGMQSLRHLVQHQVERLTQQADALASYAGVTGIGGD